MKKAFLTIGTVVIVLTLMLALPRAYEHVLPVNRSAALALSAGKPERVGELVVACLNRHNTSGVWWDERPADFLKAHEDLGGSWSSSHYVITGRLGWHVTWAAIIPLEVEPPTAFETFGAANGNDSAFGRTELPTRILGTLKRCGVRLGGVYPNPLPVE